MQPFENDSVSNRKTLPEFEKFRGNKTILCFLADSARYLRSMAKHDGDNSNQRN